MSPMLLWLWVVLVMEVLVVVGGGVGGGGGDDGDDHFRMANVDYPPFSEPSTPITRDHAKKTWARVAATCTMARSVRCTAKSLTE